MKTIRFIGYILYNYYSTGPGAGLAYFRTIMAMTSFGLLHVLQLQSILIRLGCIIVNTTNTEMTRWWMPLLACLPVYFLLTQFVKQANIEQLREKYDKDWDKVFSGRIWLLIYIICSFCLLVSLVAMESNQA